MSDLIDRQAAIDTLRKKQDNGKGDISRFYNTIIQHDIEAIMALPSSLSMNSAEVGTDCISRQDAIDALRDYLVGKNVPCDGTLTCRLIENEVINKLPSATDKNVGTKLGTNLAEVGTDCISRQAAIDLLKQMRKDGDMIPWEGKDVFARIRKLPSAQPDIIRCRECKFASGDSRICMKFGHSPIGELDFCSFAERREVTT